jgi:cell division transport system permease protein
MLVRKRIFRGLFKRWGDQIQINAYLDKGLSAADVSLLQDKIQNFPEVERVRHVSQEQAWREFRAALGTQSNVLEGLPEDVLPASFEVLVKPAFRDGPLVEALANRLRKEKGLATLEYPQEWVDRLSLVVLAVQWVKWVLGGVSSSPRFIIGSTVRLAVFTQQDRILNWFAHPKISSSDSCRGHDQRIIEQVVRLVSVVLCCYFRTNQI